MNEQLTAGQVGKILTITHPEYVKEIETQYSPVLTDLSHIKEICTRIEGENPDLEKYYLNILIVSVIYSMYAPATLIDCGNSPAGMRKILADEMGGITGPMVNYFHNIAKSHIKNRRYIKKVQAIINNYKSTI